MVENKSDIVLRVGFNGFSVNSRHFGTQPNQMYDESSRNFQRH